MKTKHPTIYEVAALADVSIGTVSNFFNRPEIVAVNTRRRIQAAVDALAFVPDVGATLLGGKAAQMIGLVLLDIANPFFVTVAQAAERTARQHEHLVILGNSNGDPQLELSYLKSLRSHRAAGVLLSPVSERSKAVLEIRDRGLPIVLVGRESKHYCCVVANNRGGGVLVGRHLADLGHKQVAFVTGRLSATQYRLRLKGLQKALESRIGKTARVLVHESAGTGTFEEGRVAARALLAARGRPSAISCGNDLLAFGVYFELLRAGIRVPDEISLVGYDDSDMAELWNLTTVRQPKLEMGQRSTELLLHEINEGVEHKHRRVLLDASLIVRKTTAEPP